MNRKIKISGFQFFCIIFSFIVGIPPPGLIYTIANQDAWMCVLIADFTACLLFALYIKLYTLFPDLQFTQYIQVILGKFVGKLMALVYIVYFIYMAARDLRELAALLRITLYNASSLIALVIITMFLVLYTLYKGFETFARANELIFLMTVAIVVLFITLEIVSNLIEFKNLRPVLENGLKPVIKGAFPITVTIPFGEIFVFTMIMPYLNKQKSAIKVGIPALLISGAALSLFAVLNIAILGVSEVTRTVFPLLTSVSYINVADFIQRMDSFIVLISVTGYYVKIVVYFYCAVSGTAELFNVKKSEQLVYPISIIIITSSLWLASSFIDQHNEAVSKAPFLLHIPLQILIPLSLLLILLLQGKLKGNKSLKQKGSSFH
ncbi:MULTISPECIES: GerAB/ArcD/ProY family transporter [unclassified Bacillus (in: firmicutes)]|uniref:GerAB/ArcD/ProY family transporter n=1 Tax=unclassified Bacillus (in: firmicutes) TaxID=185979 RepID=UPI000BF23366|nr:MULTISPECIES: GerAB/ArcD/ProY family transporter [unclassified Bacillus (in: firmicutes)]PEJ50515.1 spore gernimation protein [Bacillus sp. AFS002410]PEL03702.1 spore gernimation protein [Bacillus sp. AFS017336]